MSTSSPVPPPAPEASETVLVGTTLDAASDPVVALAHAVARAAGCRLGIVHALPSELVAGSLGLGYPDSTILESEEQMRRESLAAQVVRLGIPDVDLAGTWVRLGAPHRVLVEAAESLGSTLVVVGATAGGWARRLLGATAERLIRVAHCPVLVLRGDLPLPPRRVLVGVDLSPVSADALRRALPLLMRLGDQAPGEVVALYVLSEMQRTLGYPFTPEQVDRFAHEELERFLAANVPPGTRVEGRLRTGDPRLELVHEATEAQADVMVVGTHGASGFERFVLGSVAAEVLRDAPCTVLVVPPSAAARAADVERRKSAEPLPVPPIV